jgi:hypothetical protein
VVDAWIVDDVPAYTHSVIGQCDTQTILVGDGGNANVNETWQTWQAPRLTDLCAVHAPGAAACRPSLSTLKL